jgi:hypothetical protein
MYIYAYIYIKYIYTYVYIYISKYVYINKYIYANTYLYIDIYIYICIYNIYKHTYVHRWLSWWVASGLSRIAYKISCIYMNVYAYIYVHTHIYIYVYVYVYIHIHKHTYVHRWLSRQVVSGLSRIAYKISRLWDNERTPIKYKFKGSFMHTYMYLLWAYDCIYLNEYE